MTKMPDIELPGSWASFAPHALQHHVCALRGGTALLSCGLRRPVASACDHDWIKQPDGKTFLCWKCGEERARK